MTAFVKPKFQAFLSVMATTHDPVTFQEVVQDPTWCEAMNLELRALEANGTWVLTDLPPG